jgi:hypothetical protein
MGYTSLAQHKSSARAKRTLKLYTYEAMHQRTITIEIILEEEILLMVPTQEKQIYRLGATE